jgi:predicted dehydrogenase
MGVEKMAGIGIGLVGTGFMGKCHALALAAVRRVFGDLPEPRLCVLCDTPRARAEAMADQLGFARATDDWRDLVADPELSWSR